MPRGAPPPQQVRPSVQRILDSMTSTPAYVRNARLDILAANQLGAALFAPVLTSPAGPVNNARFLFLDPAAPGFYPDWERQAQDVVAMLRTEAGRSPHDKGLSNLRGQGAVSVMRAALFKGPGTVEVGERPDPVVGGGLYIRSAYGPGNPWFRHATASGTGRIRADGIERDVSFADAAPEVQGDIDATYHAKYDRCGPRIVGSVTGPDAHRVTVRLVPQAEKEQV